VSRKKTGSVYIHMSMKLLVVPAKQQSSTNEQSRTSVFSFGQNQHQRNCGYQNRNHDDDDC
jgi:hypothetical protein